MREETVEDNAYLYPERWKAKLASPNVGEPPMDDKHVDPPNRPMEAVRQSPSLANPYTGGPRQARPMPLAADMAAEGGGETIPHFLNRKSKSATEELADALSEIQRLKYEVSHLQDPDVRDAAGAAALAAMMHHESADSTAVPTPSGIQEETGAMRDSIGTKIDTTLVPYEFICAAAVGLNYGAKHYAPRNFEKGLSEKNLLGSIERHQRALVDGEVIDKDSGVPHACLLASSVAMYVTVSSRGDIIADLPEPSLRAGTIGGVATQFCDLEHHAREHRAAQGKDY